MCVKYKNKKMDAGFVSSQIKKHKKSVDADVTKYVFAFMNVTNVCIVQQG